MNASCKLSLNFDPRPLQADVEQLQPGDWVAHFNTGYYEGEWLGIALRSAGGLQDKLYPDPNAKSPVRDTPVLERSQNLRKLITSLKCPVRSARLLKLTPGARIKEHRDYDLGFEEGEIRLHIPIVTSSQVEFFLGGERLEMKEGECWYLNVSLPHSVDNRGSVDRIHLVIDCGVNDWLRALLPLEQVQSLEREVPTNSRATLASSPKALMQFRSVVRQNLELQKQLREISGRERFIKLVVTLGEEAGFYFLTQDVEEAMRAERRAALERWIE
jgi:hypothetical protein